MDFKYFKIHMKSDLQYKISFTCSFISNFLVFFGYYFTIVCLFDKFSKLSIREIKFKPMAISHEFLEIEILNFNHDYSFLNKFMFKLYTNIKNNSP